MVRLYFGALNLAKERMSWSAINCPTRQCRFPRFAAWERATQLAAITTRSYSTGWWRRRSAPRRRHAPSRMESCDPVRLRLRPPIRWSAEQFTYCAAQARQVRDVEPRTIARSSGERERPETVPFSGFPVSRLVAIDHPFTPNLANSLPSSKFARLASLWRPGYPVNENLYVLSGGGIQAHPKTARARMKRVRAE